MPRGIDSSNDVRRQVSRQLYPMGSDEQLTVDPSKKSKVSVAGAAPPGQPPNDPNDSNKNTPLRKDFVEHKKNLSKGIY